MEGTQGRGAGTSKFRSREPTSPEVLRPNPLPIFRVSTVPLMSPQGFWRHHSISK